MQIGAKEVRARLMVMARYVLVGIRLYLGAWMLLNGLNHFVPIFPQPMGGAMRSSQLMVTLIETGLFGVVKTLEILVGLLLLLDLFVPVALVMSLPISVVVWYNAIIGNRAFTFSMASGCLVWTLVLMLAYVRHFLPMMQAHARMGTLADFNRAGDIFSPQTSAATPESKHRALILVAGALCASALAYQLHPSTTLDAGSGKTPAVIVKDYMDLAYAQDKRAEADALYLSSELAAKETAGDVAETGQTPALRILETIAQGPLVAVYSRRGEARGSRVDLYRIARNRIVEHTRIDSAAR